MSHACHRLWKCHKNLTFCSLLTRCTIPCACHAKRHLNLQKWSENGVFCAFWLRNVLRATTACTFSTSQLPKVVREWCVLMCFVHFDFEMFFAPRQRALFRHLNFQKWSEPGVFGAFWLRNVLGATTACAFSTSQLPKVVREWCVLYILTSKCASRHNGVRFFNIPTSKSRPTLVCFVHLTSKCASRHNDVHFFISHLARWLRTRRFSEPTFRPSGATNHWKNTVLCDFPTFSRICIFFLLTLSLLSSSLFYSSLLSDSSHLCFSYVHIVGSLTSKLPSIITIILLLLVLWCIIVRFPITITIFQHLFFLCVSSQLGTSLPALPAEPAPASAEKKIMVSWKWSLVKIRKMLKLVESLQKCQWQHVITCDRLQKYPFPPFFWGLYINFYDVNIKMPSQIVG